MKQPQFINPHRWYHEYVRTARFSGSEASRKLGDLYYKTGQSQLRDQIDAYCKEGIKLAIELNEPYWELYFRLVAYEVSPERGMVNDALIKLSVDISQPKYEGCPFNVRIYHALLDAYSVNDPLGQAKDIVDGADYVEQGLPLDVDTYIALSLFRTRVYRAQRKWIDAYNEGIEYHNRALEEMHHNHIVQSSVILAEILYQMGHYLQVIRVLDDSHTALARLQDPSWEQTVHWWYLIIYKQLGDVTKYESTEAKIRKLHRVDSYDFLAGRAKIEYRHLRDDNIGALRGIQSMLTVFGKDKYRHLQIELYLDYFAYLGMTSLWDRALYYGGHVADQTLFQQRTSSRSDGLMRLILLMVMSVALIVISGLGILFDLTGFIRRRKLEDLRELMRGTKATDIYEERLSRILAGDYSQLS